MSLWGSSRSSRPIELETKEWFTEEISGWLDESLDFVNRLESIAQAVYELTITLPNLSSPSEEKEQLISLLEDHKEACAELRQHLTGDHSRQPRWRFWER
jgi:glutamine synthetase adenylyltransferase